MELEFIMPDACVECAQTQRIWQSLCQEHRFGLLVFLTNQPEAKTLIDALNLTVFPALIADRQVLAIGHPTYPQARRIISELSLKHST